jgi:hypothetical protein
MCHHSKRVQRLLGLPRRHKYLVFLIDTQLVHSIAETL